MKLRLARLALLALLAPACVRDEVDPKWELAVRTGMPFVDATPVDLSQVTFVAEPKQVQEAFDALFVRAFLKARIDEHFVLETTGPSHWLRMPVVENDWRILHLVVKADSDLVLRCYPRVGDMPYYDSDFFTDSPLLKGGSWYHVTVFVRLFRQLSEQPLRDLRFDLIGHGERKSLRFAAFYVEKER